MSSYEIEMLHRAVRKQIELRGKWGHELLDRAPPVLWFGNTQSRKPKIVTIGANPSRSEFLKLNKKQALKLLADTGDQTKLIYLEPPNENRFRVLENNESLQDILQNEALSTEILNSYNFYFKKQPYVKWFGKKEDPYLVERLLQNLNGSYYEIPDVQYTAIHLDLFPFVTVSDYSQIRGLAERDLFQNQWAQNFLRDLITYIAPELIVVFGSSNFRVFKRLFREYLEERRRKLSFEYEKNNGESVCANYEIMTYGYKTSLVGISVNLGNPRGFTKDALDALGSQILRDLHKR
ncbi:hypothetical protein [Alicyclobacillus mali (ex Roth et al. 2021)]|uniref:hypothetical protein n=1 Tax=Alicyclobacillus mali (ex Roth et al. 2021) TaxID=1123961 RepID=UPI001A8FF3FE|nr:hypothetical protein [Alicyclobacillus mali (ex Roth et al. 2021)]